MKTVIYLDTLLLVNFIIGYLLLRAAGLLAGQVPGWKNNLLGGVLAALSTLILLAPPLPMAAQLAWQGLWALAIVGCTFPRRGLRCFACLTAWYYGLNLLLAGLVIAGCSRGSGLWQTNNLAVYAALPPGLLAVCVTGVYLGARCFLWLFGKPEPKPIFRLGFAVAGRQVKDLPALWDTGFHVQDPYTGQPALLAALPAVRRQLPPALVRAAESCFAGGTPEPTVPPLRLLECRTAFGKGLLPAVTVRALTLEGRGPAQTAEKATLILCREALSQEGFSAVFGTGLFSVW